ncbi:hypothetical protein ACP26L_20015 [Paenibacillus sp. S-38]|uniref:hypothetical protein n=1 Tax=Paenibacillus sp. S-38 TaxID=3416710 RepID=UPI003CFB6F9C
MLGGNGSDVLTVNDTYSQVLTGGQGQDEYVLNGTNLDLQWISENGVKGEQDVVRLNGFSKDQLELSRDGGNLLIEAEHMRLAVDRFFVNGGYRIERFELGDCTVWTDSDIEVIIQAMAAAPASGAADDPSEEGSSAQGLNLLLAAGGAPGLI